jgi:hypothetical protein
MDFKSFLKDKNSYNIILVIVDRLNKQPISLSYYKIIISRDLAYIFIIYIWRYYRALDLIVLDQGP